jgi:Zinc carboxypeptidase
MPSTPSPRRAALCGLLFVGLASATLAASAPLLAPLTDGHRVELPPLDPAVPSPDAFLGYPLGERFTHWSEIVRYLQALDGASERVTMQAYGSTYEGRPLELVAISSSENIARLDELRRQHLRLADPRNLSAKESAELAAETPVVVWLGYGVHGNESSSAEAAMAAAYVLAAAQGAWEERLAHTIVLIDPLVNPDGRERYVHGFETRRGARPDPDPMAAEHSEPWPGGRQNHYVIDLNRDWSFATQQETQARIAAYREWEPQVFVDFHEMYFDSTYFFSPPTAPIHPQIHPGTLRWLEAFGHANAAAFDRQGWSYFVGEEFDLYYPGYGDSYPSLRAAAGMTYEMAGHGRAGSAIRRPDGSLLTLADRVARHLTTSLATAGTAADQAAALLEQFVTTRRDAMAATPASYLLPGDQPEIRAATRLLELHGIELRRLSTASRWTARNLRTGESTARAFPAGTWIVSTDQPLAAVLRAFMESDVSMDEHFLAEQRQRVERNRSPEFYDITAWSLPLAFNLEAWAVEGTARALGVASDPAMGPEADPGIGQATATAEAAGWEGVGYVAPPQGIAGYRLLAALTASDFRVRFALDSFRFGERRYPAGSIFVPREGNPDDAAPRIRALARAHDVRLDVAPTSFTDEGITLGSNEMVPLRRSSVGLVSGDGVSSGGFGGLWHMLDQTVGLPLHRIDVSDLGDTDLERLDVLILPEGRYGRTVGEATATAIKRWVQDGGVLIAVDSAVSWLHDQELTSVKNWKSPEPDEALEARDVATSTPANRGLYTPGAALATRLGGPHALLAGITAPPVLYAGSSVLLPTGDPQQDLLLADPDHPILAGFAWPEAAERLRGALLVGVEGCGDGAVVVFAQNPAFRAFWRATVPMLLNAAMVGPSLNDRGQLTASGER